VVLHTRWLELEVSSIERVAVGELRASSKLRGMYRPNYTLSGTPATADSGNNAIYDGSLIIAKTPTPSAPPPGDTLVYRYIFGEGKHAKGFRALSGLDVDTSQYGTGSGIAYARAIQTTVDSLIGIDVEYIFPQHTDSSDFVLLKYKLYNRTASAISGLIVGEAVDFDVMPSTANRKWQSASQNYAGFDTPMNLLFEQGCDSGVTANAQKYLGGMTAIQSTPSPRGWIAPNEPWLFKSPGGGFSEGYLYSQLVKTGFSILGPPPTAPAKGSDKHSVIAFEKGVTLAPKSVTLAPTKGKRYMLGFVSSTGGLPGNAAALVTQTKKAWKFAFGWQEIVDLDTVPSTCEMLYPYYASGSHADGLTSGCAGCVVTKVSGDARLTFIPDANPCTGMIKLNCDTVAGTYTAVFRVTTLPCSGPTYTDDQTVTIVVLTGGGSCCDCPSQGDVNPDLVIDVFDVIQEIAIAFSGGVDPQDPGCPRSRGDVNNDMVTDVFDVIQIIAIAFSGGTVTDPCNP